MKPIALLGPQRLQPTVGEHARRMGLKGPCALITAGWQEREDETEELEAALGLPAVNLRLYARWERLRAEDPVLGAAHRARQDRLRRLQSLYRGRLGGLMGAARKLLAMQGDDALLEPERRSAVAAVRALDAHHLQRITETHIEFEGSAHPGARAAVAGQRASLARALAGCDSVVIAGGHIAVLLSRLRLFELEPLLRDKPLIAWSAGAMAVCDRVVLFHDSPPWGAGDAELLDFGLGLAPGVVVLPHAKKRLRLHDPERVLLMARRFRPATCVPLDPGDAIARFDGAWHMEGARVLASDGEVRRSGATAGPLALPPEPAESVEAAGEGA